MVSGLLSAKTVAHYLSGRRDVFLGAGPSGLQRKARTQNEHDASDDART
jgi:hypothetical protein